MRRFPSISKSPTQPQGDGLANPAIMERRVRWRVRALQQAAAVRRLIRGARLGTHGLVGATAIANALQVDAVAELFVTNRFMELRPEVASTLTLRATFHGATITCVVGGAAFELDLFGGGIGARLRRGATPHSSARRVA
jgi:hypothetical protein